MTMLPVVRAFCIGLITIALAACDGTTYNRVETGGVVRINTVLDRGSAVLIAKPRDISGSAKTAEGASDLVVRTLDASFSRYAAIVDDSSESDQTDLRAAVAKGNYKYIVLPKITRWQGETQWSKTSPEISLKILIVDAETGQVISSSFLESKAPAKNTLSSTLNLDSENPSDMLRNLVDDYVDSLYGVTVSQPQ